MSDDIAPQADAIAAPGAGEDSANRNRFASAQSTNHYFTFQGEVMRVLSKRWWLVFLLGIFGALWHAPLSAYPAPADKQAIVKADQAFVEAAGKQDEKAVAAILDKQFEWTNAEGSTRTKDESLHGLPALKGNGEAATDTRAFNYGEVGFVDGIRDHERFLRVWVKRPDGWRLFNYLETPMKPTTGLPKGGGPCDNPCKTLPYTPTTEIDKAILEAWQKAKNDEWHPNASDWALRVADEFVIVNDHTARTKAERVALLKKQQAAGEPGPPGDPIHTIRMFDFGNDAAVMLSQHTPHHGGKPYYNVRVWVLRDGRWQLVASQQTTIESAAAASAAD
ncbi:MAG: nuclear transport factor 2 family protein [Candidatus Acidiferrales bacterium]